MDHLQGGTAFSCTQHFGTQPQRPALTSSPPSLWVFNLEPRTCREPRLPRAEQQPPSWLQVQSPNQDASAVLPNPHLPGFGHSQDSQSLPALVEGCTRIKANFLETVFKIVVLLISVILLLRIYPKELVQLQTKVCAQRCSSGYRHQSKPLGTDDFLSSTGEGLK